MQLQTATCIVTGGASGLGEACVRRFARAGAKVTILDVNQPRGQALAAELGANVHFIKTDVATESEVHNAINEAVRTFGSPTVLVNCAGIVAAERVVGKDGPLALSRFERVIQVNLIGTFNVLRLVAAQMANNTPNDAGERGVIINTASVAAYDGQIGQVAYSASKGGIVGMTLPIAREFARFGIRVLAIAPGIFDTPLMASLPEAARASLGEQVPFPARLGDPAEYAQLAQAMLENVYLNGEVIRLDGSIRMQPK